MSEQYKILSSVLEALADLRSQVENCDGTAQIDTDAADAVLAACQASQPSPERVTLAVDQLTREFKHLAKRVAALEESRPGNIRPANWPAAFVRQAAAHDAELRSAVTAESARPIPLSERNPDLEDCHCIPNSTAKDGAYIWAGSIIHAVRLDSFWNWDLVGRDYMITHSVSGRGATLYTHWLPASTKYLPARVEG